MFEQIDMAARLAARRADLQDDLRRQLEAGRAASAFHRRPCWKKWGRAVMAQLGVALIDGEPVAAQIWLVQQGRATIFKLAQDPAFDRQSPGTFLTHWISAPASSIRMGCGRWISAGAMTAINGYGCRIARTAKEFWRPIPERLKDCCLLPSIFCPPGLCEKSASKGQQGHRDGFDLA